jgi:DNA polymerase-4
MKRYIAHLDLDSFFVSVECLKNPLIKGKAIIVGGTSGRGVVSACSYEARKYGVHSAMPMVQALQLCPHAIVLKGNHDEYGYYSRWVTRLIAERVPMFEKASIDEFYMDLSGMDRYFNIEAYCRQLKNDITKETGLPSSLGLSSGKMMSKIAANEYKPNGFLVVQQGEERAFLAPLSIDKMFMIGKKTSERLKAMGIYKLGQLAVQPVEYLERKLGKAGVVLWERANGIDDSPVTPARNQKSISKEETYFQDTEDRTFLLSRIISLTQQVTHELRTKEKDATVVAVKIRYANFETHTKQLSIPPSSSDHILIPHIKSLFNTLLSKSRKVRLIGVRVSGLTALGIGATLFSEQERKQGLYEAMDGIIDKYGIEMVRSAGGMAKRKKW